MVKSDVSVIAPAVIELKCQWGKPHWAGYRSHNLCWDAYFCGSSVGGNGPLCHLATNISLWLGDAFRFYEWEVQYHWRIIVDYPFIASQMECWLFVFFYQVSIDAQINHLQRSNWLLSSLGTNRRMSPFRLHPYIYSSIRNAHPTVFISKHKILLPSHSTVNFS